MRLEIYHGLYDALFGKMLFRNTYKQIDLPLKFITLLKQKSWKWNNKKKLNYTLIPFTVGIDRDWDIWAIAIKDPRDEFSLRNGENVVKGRIKRQRGGFVPHRWEYNRTYEKDKEGNYKRDENGDMIRVKVPDWVKCHRIRDGDMTIINKEKNEYRKANEI